MDRNASINVKQGISRKIICNVLNALFVVKFAQMKANASNANRVMFWKKNYVKLNALLHIIYKTQSVINVKRIASLVTLKQYVQTAQLVTF